MRRARHSLYWTGPGGKSHGRASCCPFPSTERRGPGEIPGHGEIRSSRHWIAGGGNPPVWLTSAPRPFGMGAAALRAKILAFGRTAGWLGRIRRKASKGEARGLALRGSTRNHPVNVLPRRLRGPGRCPGPAPGIAADAGSGLDDALEVATCWQPSWRRCRAPPSRT